jgi:hypothetical protein
VKNLSDQKTDQTGDSFCLIMLLQALGSSEAWHWGDKSAKL